MGALVSETTSVVVNSLLRRRRQCASDIMVAELKSGAAKLDGSDLDDSAAILYRYLRAAEEGAARLNLRLLAAVFSGQARERSIAPDEFLYFADMLASLRRDEVILLGTLLRQSAAHPGTSAASKPGARVDSSVKLIATTLTRSELIPHVFEDRETFDAIANSLQRTGLVLMTPVTQYSAGIEVNYKPTKLLKRLNALAEIEGVLARDSQADVAREPD